jgi:hypothetical protein
MISNRLSASPHKSGLPPATPFTRYFSNVASVQCGGLRLAWPIAALSVSGADRQAQYSPGRPCGYLVGGARILQLDRSYPP